MLNIVMPMAGRGKRFAEVGYEKPKPLIPIHGRPMTEVVIENLRPSREHRFIFLILREHAETFGFDKHLLSWAPGSEIVYVESVTQGAACTVLLARDYIDNDESLMIANCDQWVDVDIDDYLAEMDRTGADGLIMTMWSDDPKWSFVKFDAPGNVVEVVEKKLVSNEATVGIYNFRKGRDFVRAADAMIAADFRVNGEFYVAPAYNELIAEGRHLVVHNVGKEDAGMYGLGIPADLERFLASKVSRKVMRDSDRRLRANAPRQPRKEDEATMTERLPNRGPWTSEQLALAVKRGERFETVAGEAMLSPSQPSEPVEPVRGIHGPLERIRLATSRWLRSRRPPRDLRVLLDVQALQGPSAARGIGRYTLNLFEALLKVRPNWRFEIVANAALPAFSGGFAEGMVTHQFPPPHPQDIWTEENDWAYAEWLMERGADALLITDLLTPPVAVPAFRNGSFPVLAVLHDLIPLLFPEHYLYDPYYVPYYIRRLGNLLTCDGVLTNSRCTAADFQRVFGPNCPTTTHIGGAVDRRLCPHAEASLDGWRQTLREKYGVEREFLLYVGGPDHRKNLTGTVRAFAKVALERRSGVQLVIACGLEDRTRDQLCALAAEEGLSDRVLISGHVSDEELVALYQLARLFLFPSLYEGLGFPLLEALTCGAPVVCGENSSIPEYSGPHAFIADPSDPQAFARAIEAGLSEPRVQHLAERQEFAASFTWESAAEQAAQAITRSAAARSGVRKLAS